VGFAQKALKLKATSSLHIFDAQMNYQ